MTAAAAAGRADRPEPGAAIAGDQPHLARGAYLSRDFHTEYLHMKLS